jgi:ATP-dependent exoDNAse (exonuclease V) alpha subunit
VDTALDALAGPDELTGQVSTFTRTDVVDALAKRLPVAPSAQEALTQVEAAADRFLQERAVRVGRDGRLGVDCYSTPELLALERQLVDGATSRAEQGCALVRPEVVRHLTQGGAGVAVVVGRAGSGKTWALGLAREAFELDGYQVLGTAPTGIATVALADEGFTDARTVDRLLLDLQHRRTELDDRTVLVVDEAAMVTTRKLAPLLVYAERAGTKVALVGDDRQFASIQAGGGFRALRQRLGASELTVNRRQVEAWEQRAIDDVRAGNLEQAIAAYAEHDRIRAYEARDDRGGGQRHHRGHSGPGPTRAGDDGADPGGGAAQYDTATRPVPGRRRPPGAVAPGRSRIRADRHALPGKDRTAGAAGSGWGRGHAGRLCAAHPQHPADRPVPDGGPGTSRPRRPTGLTRS